MKGSFRKRGCNCPKDQRCKCGATWSFRINGKDPRTGKRLQPEFHGYSTKKEAEDACAIEIVKIQNGTFVSNSKIIFKDYAKEWLEGYSKTKKISSARIRKSEVTRLIEYLAHLKMTEITKKHYQDCLDGLFAKGYSDNTRGGTHTSARMIFKAAMKDGLIKVDPSEYAVFPRKQKSVEELEAEEEVPKYLEKEELARFLRVAKEKGRRSDGIFFLVLAYSGLRIGELLALKWRDIDFDEKTLSVTKTLYNQGNRHDNYRLLTPKTVTSRRLIDLDDLVIEELKKHRSKENEFKMSKRDVYHDQDFIITNHNFPGYPETPQAYEHRMTSLLKKAKLNSDLSPHSLRHTHTSLMAEAGATLPEIMERLGHSDDNVTKRVYLHVTKSMRKKTGEKFGELMRSINN